MMRQYYIPNLDPRADLVFEFIKNHALRVEVHLNRTRFWVPDGMVHTQFAIQFSESCPLVDDSLDLATGFPKTDQHWL
jgi:hypothetical protein